MNKPDFANLGKQAVQGIISSSKKVEPQVKVKRKSFQYMIEPELRAYLDTMVWYDRCNSIADYLSNLIRKDMEVRQEEYQEALALKNK